MNAPIAPLMLEPDDLLRMPDGRQFELVDGIPLEKHMGAKSDRIALRLGGLLDQFCIQHGIGFAFGSSTGYQCYPQQPGMVRKPDTSFVCAGRFPNEEVPDGHIPIPPDLAVEVVSPNDLSEEVEAKVAEYLAAGVRLVWIVHPSTRSVHIRRADGSSAVLTEADTLSGETVVPGFTCRVSELFV